MKLNPHMALANQPFQNPGLVLTRELADQRYTIALAAGGFVGTIPAVHVHISLDADRISALVTPQEWYFAAATGLPLRVEHRLPDNRDAKEFTQAAEQFSDFRKVFGLLVPFQILGYEDGSPLGTVFISTVAFNSRTRGGSRKSLATALRGTALTPTCGRAPE